MKLFLKFSITILLFYLIFYRCKKEDTNPSNNLINGQLYNWTSGADKFIKLGDSPISYHYIFGSSSIDNSGNFNISPLTSPSSDLLIPVDSLFGRNIILSKYGVKGIFGYLCIYSNAVNRIGFVEKTNNINFISSGQFYVGYIYVNNDVIITGTGTITFPQKRNICNISLKAGWNKYICKTDSVSIGITTNEISDSEPTSGEWLYQFN